MKVVLIFLLVLIPLFFVYQRGEGYFFNIHSQAKEALAQGLIAVLFCMWLLKREFKIGMDSLNLPIVIFLAIVCLSMFWAYNHHESLKFIKRWLSHILLYFIIVNNVRKEDVRRIMTAMVLTATVVSAYSIAQYSGLDYWKFDRLFVGSSTMGNPTFVGAFLAGVVPLGLGLSMQAGRLKRVLCFLLSLCLLVTLVIVNSRAAWIGMVGAIAVMFVLSLRKRILLRYLALALVSLAVIFSLAFSSYRVNLSSFTSNQRIGIWKGTMAMIRERPLLGVGIGNFSLVYPFYQTKEALETCGDHFIRQAHNEYLELGSTIGILGLIVFLWIFFVLARKYRRGNVLALGLLGGIVATLITAFFGFNLQNESTALYLWASMGLYTVSLR